MHLKKSISFIFFFFILSNCIAQIDSVKYKAEAFTSLSTGNKLPFWLVTNRNGIIPDERADLLYLGLKKDYSTSKPPTALDYSYGFDVATSYQYSKYALINQYYASLRYNKMQFFVGAKNPDVLYNGLSMSNGDFIYSSNARNIPKIELSLPNYIRLPIVGEYFSFKGHISEGLFLDNRFAKDVHLHSKALYGKVEYKAWSLECGFRHSVQWGGTSTGPNKIPSMDFNSYIRMFFAKGGAEDNKVKFGDSTFNEWENGIGNHLGGWDIRLHYDTDTYNITLYKQSFLEDHSGVYITRTDGLYGLSIDYKDKDKIVNGLIAEFCYTLYQSGIPDDYNDENTKPGEVPTGGDNYFNNSVYLSGWTNYGRVIGIPFITAQSSAANGLVLSVDNNRIIAYNIGISGRMPHSYNYKLLLSYSNNYGMYALAFNPVRGQFSSCLEINKKYESLPFDINLRLAFDKGQMYDDNNFAAQISIRKTGFLNSLFK